MGVKAILFDHTALRTLCESDPGSLTTLLQRLQGRGVRWAALATHDNDLVRLQTLLKQIGLPSPNLQLSRTQLPGGKPKGSPEWVQEAARRFRVCPWHLVYVGDDAHAWRSALNGGSVYVHARWSKPLPSNIISAIVTGDPESLWVLLEHLFLRDPMWSYSVDRCFGGPRLQLRCLLPASVNLPHDSGWFRLQDIFTYCQTTLTVGGMPAHHLLMLHALSNLYLEGLIRPSVYFCVYPGHVPGKANPVLDSFLSPATAFFSRSYHKQWIRRFKRAPDTSRQRQNGRQPSFLDQANTVCLDKNARKRMAKRPTVIVFDDVTTDGMSFEWARNLLYKAGARSVVLVAIGKYGWYHRLQAPKPHLTIRPFEEQTYTAADFTEKPVLMSPIIGTAKKFEQLFRQWQQKRPWVRIERS